MTALAILTHAYITILTLDMNNNQMSTNYWELHQNDNNKTNRTGSIHTMTNN